MQLTFWCLFIVSIMLTCVICGRTDFTDNRGLSVHTKACKKRVQVKVRQPKKPAKRQKTQHVPDVPSGDVSGDQIGSNTNLSTPIPEILEFVSFLCLLFIGYVTNGN
jgi:hypothetical protein